MSKISPAFATSAEDSFCGLQPAAVWRHFSTLCRIPRASKHEAAVRRELADWAADRGLAAMVDEAGNLLVRKPASAGYEASRGVVLQAHLDMVCQANAGVPHDFLTDPIRPVCAEGWMRSPDTTLGADNGIGVALMLAVLEDETICHGPLEALFTVDEEAGMGGARGLAPGWLQGRLMLNLDTEAWGEFYLGCAGGLDVNVHRAAGKEVVPEGWVGGRINLCGLRGGHSGVDIHEGRGNAIKLLVRLLQELARMVPLRLSGVVGGNARNALPREAAATFAVAAEDWAAVSARVADIEAVLRAEFAGIDDGLSIELGLCDLKAVMDPAEQAIWLSSLHAAPHGVHAMSRQVPGVVETSNNLGMVDLQPDGGACNFMVRSLRDSAALALADQIVSLFALSGTVAETAGHYPGWAPNPDSALLARCQEVFRTSFGEESTVQVIHAGLECGLIGAKYPGMDIVSFGPTIRGAHAPGEQVEIASVGRCFELLKAVLASLK